MGQYHASNRRAKRTARPLDPKRLEELALAYVARFATSAGKLETYLRRKLRERGYVGAEDGGEPPDVAALVGRFVAKGYVDDEGYARARADGLLRRGYGARRVGETLAAAGIAPELREEMAPGEAQARAAALALARRRRFGAFAMAAPQDFGERAKLREKQLAAMLRAGHGLTTAKHVLDAASPAELEEWVAEAQEDREL